MKSIVRHFLSLAVLSVLVPVRPEVGAVLQPDQSSAKPVIVEPSEQTSTGLPIPPIPDGTNPGVSIPLARGPNAGAPIFPAPSASPNLNHAGDNVYGVPSGFQMAYPINNYFYYTWYLLIPYNAILSPANSWVNFNTAPMQGQQQIVTTEEETTTTEHHYVGPPPTDALPTGSPGDNNKEENVPKPVNIVPSK